MSSSSIFNGPLGAEIAVEIDNQVEGLSGMEAFAALMRIIETESSAVDEANIRACYAYQKISEAELWNTQYASLGEWKAARDIDDRIIPTKANATLTRIKSAAAVVKANWNVNLEAFAEKPSKDLALALASLSRICPDLMIARQVIEACRRERYLAEPNERGRGVPSTDKLLPMDVRNATKHYQSSLSLKRGPPSPHRPRRAGPQKRKKSQLYEKDSAYQPGRASAPSSAPLVPGSQRSPTPDDPEFGRCTYTPLGGEFSPELPRFPSEPLGMFSPQLAERSNTRLEQIPDIDSDRSFQLGIPSFSDKIIIHPPAPPPLPPITSIQPGKYAAKYDQKIRGFDNLIQTLLEEHTAKYTSMASFCTTRVTLATAFQRDCHRRLARVMKHQQSLQRSASDTAEAVQTVEKRHNGYLLLQTDLLSNLTRYGPATEGFTTDTLNRLRLTMQENVKQLTEKRRALESITAQQSTAYIDFYGRLDQWEKAQKAEAIATTAAKASTSGLQTWWQYVRESHTTYIGMK